MRLSPDRQLLLQKRARHALRPAEILASAILGTMIFAASYGSSCFSTRYSAIGLTIVGIVVCILICVLMTTMATLRVRHQKPARNWVAAAALTWLCFAAGVLLGNEYWYSTMVKYHTWRDMASYVNIDPDMDKGQSYMDAGTVYFKEGSHVLSKQAVAFRNGATYCVAPIVRSPLEGGSGTPQTVNGFTLPRSGTVDFWAVGTDCCGASGDSFECGDAKSGVARSGLRILEEASRSMYLLGVQEWSATTGLPVRHPLFFEWVKDPIKHQEEMQSNCSFTFALRTTLAFFGSLVVCSLLHNYLAKTSLSH